MLREAIILMTSFILRLTIMIASSVSWEVPELEFDEVMIKIRKKQADQT
jgi:hypothetical protein|tara:strand:+ start:3708 stop:3854 length:147 start_codon:yes stop_codon:yes gene_type:complete